MKLKDTVDYATTWTNYEGYDWDEDTATVSEQIARTKAETERNRIWDYLYR